MTGNSIQINRSRRRRSSKRNKTHGSVLTGPILFVAMTVCFVVALLWIGSVALFSVVGTKKNKRKNHVAVSRGGRNVEYFDGFPSSHIPDLWPDDSGADNEHMGNVLQSCLDQNDDEQPDSKCRQRREPGSSVQRVGILRPPGVIGRTMEEFVRGVVNRTVSQEGDKVELLLVGTSRIDPNHSFTKIIRFATLPVLLEALDLILGTFDEDKASSSQQLEKITLKDVLGTVRLIVRWHCRLSVIAEDSSLLTLTTQMVMSHPTGVKRNLGIYLGLREKKGGDEDGSIEDILLNGRSGNVLRRIDESTAALTLLNFHPNISLRRGSLQDIVDETLEDELRRGTCGDSSVVWTERFWTSSVHKSRTTEIIGHLLDASATDSSDEICKVYPTIFLCSSTATG